MQALFFSLRIFPISSRLRGYFPDIRPQPAIRKRTASGICTAAVLFCLISIIPMRNLFFFCESWLNVVSDLAVSVSVSKLFFIPVEKLIRCTREILHQAAYVSSYSAGSVRLYIAELQAVSVFCDDTVLRIIFRVELIICYVATVFSC